MSKIDITGYEWTELVFEGKNKEYGAYEMRNSSSKRHIIALIIVSVVAIIGFLTPAILEFALPKGYDKEIFDDQTVLTDLKDKEDEKEDVNEVKPIDNTPPPEIRNSIQFTAPIIKDDDEVTDEKEIKSQDELNELKNLAISTQTILTGDDNAGKLIEEVKTTITQMDDEPRTYVEQMPMFPGGDDELYKYLNDNIRYPIAMAEGNIQGKVTVRFVVTKTGEIDKNKIEIIRGLHPAGDREARRLVESMPKWNPGKQNGVAVAVWYTLPITYRLIEK
ncbi:MAG: energy transducer TonB [Prevotellaceae bacterium]|jgi:protein TonB|nr:energy transducer TonB [Prevotellaceae bacterium]